MVRIESPTSRDIPSVIEIVLRLTSGQCKTIESKPCTETTTRIPVPTGGDNIIESKVVEVGIPGLPFIPDTNE